MKKIMLTTIRTLMAIAIIIGAVSLAIYAFNWQNVYPNSELTLCWVITMFLLSLMGVGIGFYGISPIFWISALGVAGTRIKGDYGYTREARRAIIRLRKTWAW